MPACTSTSTGSSNPLRLWLLVKCSDEIVSRASRDWLPQTRLVAYAAEFQTGECGDCEPRRTTRSRGSRFPENCTWARRQGAYSDRMAIAREESGRSPWLVPAEMGCGRYSTLAECQDALSSVAVESGRSDRTLPVPSGVSELVRCGASIGGKERVWASGVCLPGTSASRLVARSSR